MTIEYDGPSGVITVHTDELQLVQSVPTVIYDHSMDDFWRKLRAAEDSEDVRHWPSILEYNQPFDVGVELAATLKITEYWTITYVDGQYSVNLRGLNTNVAQRVNRNQVAVWPENSAGLTYSKELRRQSYVNTSVYFDAIEGLPGANYPRGIPTDAVDNAADLLLLLDDLALNRVYLKSPILSDRNFSGLQFYCNLGAAVFNANGFQAQDCLFERLIVSGDFNSSKISITQSWTLDLFDISGLIHDSNIGGNIRIMPDSELIIRDCTPTIDNEVYPIFDMNAGNITRLKVTHYPSDFTIINCDRVSDLAIITLESGKVTIASSCTAGKIILKGIGNVVNNSNGTNVVIQNPDGISVDIPAIVNGILDEDLTGHNIDNSTAVILKLAEFYSKYNGVVYYDSSLLSGGSGTKKDPFGALNDTIDFAENYGITQIACFDDVEFTRQAKNFLFTGVGASLPTLNLNGQIVTNSKFYQVKLEGNFIGPIITQECEYLAGAYIHGYADDCAFNANCVLAGDVHIINSRSQVSGDGYMSFITSNYNIQVSGWVRSLGIIGMLSGTHTIHMKGGQFHIDATSTGGAISLRGDYSDVPDIQSTGTNEVKIQTAHKSTADAIDTDAIASQVVQKALSTTQFP